MYRIINARFLNSIIDNLRKCSNIYASRQNSIHERSLSQRSSSLTSIDLLSDKMLIDLKSIFKTFTLIKKVKFNCYY